MTLTFDELRRLIAALDRGKQLDLAHWIIHRDEKCFDLTETDEDLASIRRGLEQVERGESYSTDEVLARLGARGKA